jgi:hypothetical protein
MNKVHHESLINGYLVRDRSKSIIDPTCTIIKLIANDLVSCNG